jgi:DNA-binding NarL/FixJ family response regulator
MSSPKPLPADGDRSVSSVRVLVVDDYESFRRFVCSTLGQWPDFQLIGEASDGLEAVQKAQELQPDLIVLDIGLPKLNGIEAARRIRKLAPESKIIFLSQESSADVVQEALSSGALGYVVKAKAGSELLTAVEAVRHGRQFVSSGLSVDNFNDAADRHAPDHLCRKEALPSLAPRNGEIDRSHAVEFYSDETSFLVGFARFIEAALNAGNAVIVVVTKPHLNNLFQRLQAQGLNIGDAIERGSYIPLDVADTLPTFMVNDLPDPVRFLKVAGDLVAAAAKAAKGEHPRVAACGECAPTLWAQGKADAAVQLEHLWDDMARTSNMDILCGYVLNSFQREQEGHIYERICAEHSAVCSQ